ncbi:MFS transporter [Mesorhizobium sp. B2-4-17]|uniref:MFS transporter n=1 Tax=Mesorhizobium sp. B2-4-17 TaxID=2589932 RepID=UPI0011265C2E|nr:MFS transporter [Mesorhizobium sp. B2-4-17]TPK72038.1 MFS transporter [Mesorhizobium sp. B2-4-17]
MLSGIPETGYEERPLDVPPVSNAIRIYYDRRLGARPRVLIGFLVSTFAASIGRNGYYIACAWALVQAGYGSAGVAILLAIVSVVEFIASPLAGIVADRFDRRRLNTAADVGRFAVMLATAFSLLYLDVFPSLCLSGVLFSICDRVALTASQAMIPLVAGGADLAAANSSVFFVMQLGSLGAALLAGPLLGGHSPAPALAALALFFLVSAGSLLSLRLDPIPHSITRPNGLAPTVDRRLLRLFAAYALLYGGAVLVTVMGSSFIFEEQKGTAADFGHLEAAWSAGSLIGAVLFTRLTRAVSAPILHLLLLGSTALALMSLIALRAPWTLIVFATLGCLYTLGRVSIEVTLQSRVGNSVLGRAKGVMHSLAVTLGLLIFSTATVVGDSVFPSTVFVSFGAVLLISIPALSLGVGQRKDES